MRVHYPYEVHRAPVKRHLHWPRLVGIIAALTFCALVWRLFYLYIVLPVHDVMPALAEMIGKLGRLFR